LSQCRSRSKGKNLLWYVPYDKRPSVSMPLSQQGKESRSMAWGQSSKARLNAALAARERILSGSPYRWAMCLNAALAARERIVQIRLDHGFRKIMSQCRSRSKGKNLLILRISLQGGGMSQCRSRSKGKNHRRTLPSRRTAPMERVLGSLNAALAARERISFYKGKQMEIERSQCRSRSKGKNQNKEIEETTYVRKVSMPLSQQGKESLVQNYSRTVWYGVSMPLSQQGKESCGRD